MCVKNIFRNKYQETGREEEGVRKIEKFEDLEVWEICVRLSMDIYNSLKGIKDL